MIKGIEIRFFVAVVVGVFVLTKTVIEDGETPDFASCFVLSGH